VEFRILGPLDVRDDDRPVPITGAKERALLAMLLLHANEAVSTDRLVDALWGEAPPPTARKSLQVRVTTLRRALPEDVLVTLGEGYALRVDRDQLDLHRFERLVARGGEALEGGDPRHAASTLREALALWRGPALADFLYEPFAEVAIVRLEELRLAALELRIDADAAVGADAQLVAELKALVAEHPLRERLRAQLMLALYRHGRQAEALEVYRETRETLTSELGIEPGPALRELHAAILRQEVTLTPAVPGRSILVAARDAGALALAESLARRPPRELILADLVSEAAEMAAVVARLNGWRQELLERGVAARAVTFTTSARGDDLVRLGVELDVDLLVVDGPPDLRSDVVTAVLARAPSDVAVHVSRGRLVGPGHVLVLFGGSEHDWTALEIGAWIARARESPLRIGGPARGRERDASRALGSASLAVQRVLGIAAEPVLVRLDEEAVLAAAADAAVVVSGLSERWPNDGLGRVRGALAERADVPVLFVRRGLRPGGLAPRESLTRFTWTLGPAVV
jgi:DNA-binding SARP family transcriptional activator